MRTARRTSLLSSILLGLLASAVPVLADHTAAPGSVTLAGSFQQELGCAGDWMPACAATHLSDDAEDTVWQGTFLFADPGNYAYKAALNDSWTENYGANATAGGADIGLTVGANTSVKFYYDHETHWIADNVNQRIATAVGDFQEELGCTGDWQPACLRSWMQDPDGDGTYTFTTTELPPGNYAFKVAMNEAWTEAYPASDVAFSVPLPDQPVTFRFVSATNAVSVQVGVGASHDNTVFWAQLGHDSRNPLYRSPGGAVPTGTDVRLRLRAASGDLTAARVRLWNDRLNVESFREMSLVVDDGTYEWWEATVPGSADPTITWYRFVVVDGTDVDYYADDTGKTGGWGAASDEIVDIAWQISVHTPDFTTPDWVKEAVIYQIFPDRFRDGNPANNTADGSFFYGSQESGGESDAGTIHRSNGTEWNTVICDPRNAGSPCPNKYSDNFYGGDLQGILDKLDYLEQLGVKALYLNPVFESPSNHKYDTGDYSVIDDNFGSLALFQQLSTEAHDRGMHIILDGVFNHTSSDSKYFDFYKRFDPTGAPTTLGLDDNSGACEGSSSPYYPWFYFPADGNPGGGGVDLCPNGAGDANQTYEAWFGYGSLPKLKANTQDVRELIWDANDPEAPEPIGPYWMQWADGWRLDVGGDVDPGITNDPGNTYWEGFRDAVRAANPDAYIVGEEWAVATAWTLGPEWDATMNYQFSSAVLGFWRDEEFRDNDHASDSSAGVISRLLPSALDERLKNLQERYPAEAHAAMMNLLGSHDTSRALFMLDHNTDLNDASIYLNPSYDWSDAITRLKGVALLQLTLPGAPTIYYGDEVGLVGPPARAFDKWEDDPYNRMPFPWLEGGLGTPYYAHLQTQAGQDQLLDHYKLLTRARNEHRALRRGSFDTLLVDDTNEVYAYGRKVSDPTDAAVVIANRSGTARNVTLDVEGYLPVGAQFADALDGNQPYTVDGSGQLVVNGVPARGGALLVLTANGAEAPEAVADLSVTAEGDQQIDLSWGAATGAASYDVYRSRISGGGYGFVASTNALTYSDTSVTNGIRYYYVVVSRGADLLASGYSNEVNGLPSFDLSNSGTSSFNLQWPPSIAHTISSVDATDVIYGRILIDGATSLPGQLDGVRAQVGYGPDGTQPDGNWLWSEMAYSSDQGSDDEYMATLMPEQTGNFDYAVRWSGDGGLSWYLSDLSGPQRDGTLDNPGNLTVNASLDSTDPEAPVNLRVTATLTGSISLAWDANGDLDLSGYELYRRVASPQGSWTKISRLDAGDTSTTDASVAANETYDYHLLAFDTSFNFSAQSNTVQATAELRPVDVTFTVTVPAGTPGTVYIVGNQPSLGPWNPGLMPMTQQDATTWTIDLAILDTTALEYKFTRGSWETVEAPASGISDVSNRSMTVAYGTDGTQSVDVSVPKWRDPLVTSFGPASGATDVPLDSVVTVAWDQPMQSSTDFTVEGPGGSLAGTFTYDPDDREVTFTPDGPLAYGTTYTVLVQGEQDAAGSDFQQVSVQWSFTTLGPPPTETPTVTATSVPSSTPTVTATATGTPQPTSTPTGTLAATATPTGTLAATATPTGTLAATATPTGTLAATATGTPVASATATGTAQQVSTPTATGTAPSGSTPTATGTAPSGSTPTATATGTPPVLPALPGGGALLLAASVVLAAMRFRLRWPRKAAETR